MKRRGSPKKKSRRFLKDEPIEATPMRFNAAGHPIQRDFERLVQSYERLIFQHVFQIVQDFHSAQDLSQEVLLKVYRNVSSYDPKRRFSTWLLRVTHNHVLDHLRKNRLKTVSMDQPSFQDHPALAERLFQRGGSPQEQVLQKSGLEGIRRAIEKMPADQRSILSLRFLEGRKLDDISYILGLPLGTVKSRLSRAREGLRVKLF